MMVDVKINGSSIKILDDLIINKTQKETLGYATIKFKLNQTIRFSYFDYVEIDNKKYYLIDWRNNKKYYFELDVVTPEIALQSIILPNRARVADEETIADFLDVLTELYAPEYDYTPDVKNYFNDKLIKDFTWSKPTLFEVLNDIFATANAVVKMDDYYTIGMRSLEESGLEFDGDVTHVEVNSDFENHATSFATSISNAMSDNLIKEYVRLSTPDAPILMDNNFALYLSQPIERIHKITAMAGNREKYADSNYFNDFEVTLLKKDITSMLKERRIYDTLLSSVAAGSDDSKKKYMHLWYEYGGNVIGGFDYDDGKWWAFNASTMFYIKNLVDSEAGDVDDMPLLENDELIFLVEYVARIDKIDVNLKQRADVIHDKRVVYNQDDAFIDMDLFANKQALDLARTHGFGIELHGINKAPELLQSYKGFIIYNVLINHNRWTAYGKENYVELNLRTAVSKERRFTSIEPSSKALIMNHITNLDFEFWDEHSDLSGNELSIAPYFDIFTANIQEAFVIYRTDVNDNHRIIFNLFLEKYGNSLLAHFKMRDNTSAGLRMASEEGKNAQRDVIYTDSEGKFHYHSLYMFKGDYLSNIEQALAGYSEVGNDKTNLYLFLLKNLPMISDTSEVDSKLSVIPHMSVGTVESLFRPDAPFYTDIMRNRYKSSREIVAETLQYNLLSNEKTIIWNEYFIPIYWGVAGSASISVKFNTSNSPYTLFDYDKGVNGDISDISFVVDGNRAYYEVISDIDYTGFILFNNGRPMLAYNGSAKRIYLRKALQRLRDTYLLDEQSFNINIIDTQGYTHGISGEMQDVFNFDIKDKQGYIASGEGVFALSFNFNIKDKQQYILSSEGQLQASYNFDIKDKQSYFISTTISGAPDKIPAPKPSPPTMASRTSNSITLVAIANGRYRRGSGAWQSGVVFSGLSVNTSYTFQQKIAETPEYLESLPSNNATLTTDKGSQSAPAAPSVDQRSTHSIGLVDLGSGVEYMREGGSWQDSREFTGLTVGMSYRFYARRKATTDYYASPASGPTTISTLKYTQSAPGIPTAYSVSQTVVTLNAIPNGLYRIHGGNWQAGETFTGLNPGEQYLFYQKYAETSTHYESDSSGGASIITLPASPALNAPTFTTVEVNVCEQITFKINNPNNVQVTASYSGGSKTISANSSATVALSHTLNPGAGGTFNLKVTLSRSGYTNSSAYYSQAVPGSCIAL